jgi:hypothetical protein
VAFIRENLLCAEPESVDGTSDTGEEAGVVKEGSTVILTGFNFESFGFEFSEIGGEAFIEGSVRG